MEYQKLSRLKFTVLLFGVFATSFGVLAFEISLTRIFSIMLDYHYTFLVVSLAMFGLGIGGFIAQYFSSKTLLSNSFSRLAVMTVLFSLSTSILTLIVVSFPNLSTGLQVFMMFIPFLIGGAVLATAYKVFVSRSNVLHFADLVGAAVGVLAVVFLFTWAGAVAAVLLVSVATLFSSLFFALASRKKTVILVAFLAIIGMTLFVQYSSSSNLWNVQPASDQGKELTSYLSNPSIGAKIVDSRWSAFGQVDLVESVAEPHNKVIFVDGGAGTALYHFNGDFNSSDSKVPELRYSTQYLPYTFVNKSNALVIGPGGGLDVLTALMGGVNHIYAVEVNPSIVEIVRDYSNYAGGIYSNYSNVHVIIDEGRSYLKRSNQTYDIIMLDIPVSKTAQGTFGYALAENYLFTTDSFTDYLNHLSDDGFLTIVAHNQEEIYKLTSIAFKVLGAQGLGTYEIMQRMAVVGNIDTMGHSHSALPIFILKKTPIANTQAALIDAKASEMGLESLYTPFPGGTSVDPVLKALYDNTVSIDDLVSQASFNMKAPTDDNPFFYKSDIGVPSTLSSLLFGAIGLSAMVSIFYVLARRRQEALFMNGTRTLVKSKFSSFKWYCFASLGVGFMLIEVALIQKFILFLGAPTFAIATSLFSLLIAGGVGSFFSRKWSNGKQNNVFKVSLIIGAMVVVYIFALPSVFNATLSYSTPVRFLISFLLISPLGFLMGIPFPTLLGYIKKESENDAAWMWCINGGFSVLAGILAIVVAMYYGFNAVLLMGALTYLGLFLFGRIYENNHKIGSVRQLYHRKRQLKHWKAR